MRINQLVVTLFTFAFAILFSTSLSAEGLTWKTNKIERVADFGQKKVEVYFEFENNTDGPITISNTSTSCGCTVASLDKKTYQPGESGKLGAVFDIGQRIGKQEKRISVFTGNNPTTNQPNKDTELTLKVDIPQAVELKPRIRIWKLDEPAKRQTIDVIVHEKLGLEIDSLTPINDDAKNFTYEIEKTNQPGGYLIHFTPVDNSVAARGRFYLNSKSDTLGALRKYPIYTFIR